MPTLAAVLLFSNLLYNGFPFDFYFIEIINNYKILTYYSSRLKITIL